MNALWDLKKTICYYTYIICASPFKLLLFEGGVLSFPLIFKFPYLCCFYSFFLLSGPCAHQQAGIQLWGHHQCSSCRYTSLTWVWEFNWFLLRLTFSFFFYTTFQNSLVFCIINSPPYVQFQHKSGTQKYVKKFKLNSFPSFEEHINCQAFLTASFILLLPAKLLSRSVQGGRELAQGGRHLPCLGLPGFDPRYHLWSLPWALPVAIPKLRGDRRLWTLPGVLFSLKKVLISTIRHTHCLSQPQTRFNPNMFLISSCYRLLPTSYC